MRRTTSIFLACAMIWMPACGSGEAIGATDSGTDSYTGTGIETSESDTEETAGPDQFGDEREFELRLNEAPTEPLKLTLNKEQAQELFGEYAKDILLLEVDTTPLLVNSLNEIKNACGTDWQQDNPDPNHDCSQTELGQSFGPNWESSPEYSLVRLLTMTPANADVTGTSIEGLEGVASFLDLGGGFNQILADSLGIERTDEFIDTENLTKSMQGSLLGSHPNMPEDGVHMPVTMHDALFDFAPLGETYGPIGDHPGMIAPGFVPQAEALGPDFAMTVIADSNIRLLDGLDVSRDKDYMSILADTVGPSYDDELEFDFNDPNKFWIDGVLDNPTVDLKFAIFEEETYINSCSADDACQDNIPENMAQIPALFPGSAWLLDKWLLEYTIILGARYKYNDRVFYECYTELFGVCFFNAARVYIGPHEDNDNQNPPGWAVFDVLFDIGNPPENQYLWELILEVAQVALHTPPGGDIPEGEADVEFTLYGIPIGLTGEQITESTRPFLQEQASLISDLLLGNYKENNGKVDFYYRVAPDEKSYLYFIHPEDLQDGDAYNYSAPGFYDCPEATANCKVSKIDIAGTADDIHEKYKLPAGESVLYIRDDEDKIYRTKFIVPQGDAPGTIIVRVAEKL